MAANLDFLAGIGTRKIGPGQTATAQDFAADRMKQIARMQMEAITTSLKNIISDIQGVTGDILYDALEPTMELAKEYTPVDTGALVESAYMDKTTYPGGARVVIGFAKGGEPAYGVLVHELTNLHHEAPTRSKFLLAAIEEDAAGIYARILRGFKLP